MTLTASLEMCAVIDLLGGRRSYVWRVAKLCVNKITIIRLIYVIRSLYSFHIGRIRFLPIKTDNL